MGSSKVKAQGQIQSYVTSAFIWYLKKNQYKHTSNLATPIASVGIEMCIYKSMYT